MQVVYSLYFLSHIVMTYDFPHPMRGFNCLTMEFWNPLFTCASGCMWRGDKQENSLLATVRNSKNENNNIFVYLDPECWTIKVCQKPFMCIHVERVSFFYTINVMSVFWTYTSTSSICSINMKPHSMTLQKGQGSQCKVVIIFIPAIDTSCKTDWRKVD